MIDSGDIVITKDKKTGVALEPNVDLSGIPSYKWSVKLEDGDIILESLRNLKKKK